MALTRTIGLFILSMVSFCVKAQEDSLATQRLQEVVIRSPRISGKISRLPAVQGVDVWSGKKSEVINVSDLDANIAEKTGRQVFAKVPGTFVYDMDGSGNQVNISLRGLDPHRGWEFNVRKNGVITNSDMYGYPASHYSLPMEAVERIEIVRGTGSLQYGAQFGGMLNYVVKRPDSTKRFTFENLTTAGSFGLLSSYNAIGGRIGRFEYMAYYQKRVSNGYRDNAHSESDAQGITLRWLVSNSLKVTADIGRSTYVYRMPGQLTDEMFYNNPRQATRTRNYFNPEIYVPSLTFDWSATSNTRIKWTTSAVLGARNSVMFDKPANVVDAIDPVTLTYANRQVDIDNFRSFTSEVKVLHNYRLFNASHLFTGGVQVMNNDLHRRNLGKGTTGSDFDLTLVEPGFARDLHFKTNNIALFFENSFRLTNKLRINPGARLEIGRSDMTGTITYYDPGQLPNSIYHKFPLLGLNAEYTIDKSQNLYAGVSQSYRPVIFKDIIPASTYEKVDKDLKDAYGYTIEVGYRGQSKAFTWDIGGFQMQYNNRMGTLAQYDEQNNFYLYRTNIGNSLTRGAEIFIEYSATLGKLDLSVFTSSALFHARYLNAVIRNGEENVDITGNKVESVPDIITRNGVTMRFMKFSASVLYSYTAETFADALNTLTPAPNGSVGLVPSYGLIDLNTSCSISKHLIIKLNVNNLLDKQYFTKRPQFYPGPGVWSSDGRSITASVSVKI